MFGNLRTDGDFFEFPSISQSSRDALLDVEAGATLFNTDKGVMEVWGGSKWSPLGGGGTDITYLGGSEETLITSINHTYSRASR